MGWAHYLPGKLAAVGSQKNPNKTDETEDKHQTPLSKVVRIAKKIWQEESSSTQSEKGNNCNTHAIHDSSLLVLHAHYKPLTNFSIGSIRMALSSTIEIVVSCFGLPNSVF